MFGAASFGAFAVFWTSVAFLPAAHGSPNQSRIYRLRPSPGAA